MNDKRAQGTAQPDKANGLRRRFYKSAAVEPLDGEFILTLDGNQARTPAGRALALPTRAASEALAAEWQGVGEWLDPGVMPLTRIANSALDTVAGTSDAIRADIVQYAGTDMLCYRADAPQPLVAAQSRAWDPVLAWAAEALHARFVLVEGLMYSAQPEPALHAVKLAVAEIPSPLPLASLHVMTTLTGSALLALAVARGRLTADEAWTAAHVDEDVQMQMWGTDAQTIARRALRWRDMEAAARLFAMT